MHTEQFLGRLLPADGLKCIAIQLPKGFQHIFLNTVREAAAVAQGFDKRGRTVYYALATFRTDESRKVVNALALKAFWLDIDCGESKPYPAQEEGLQAVAAFVETAKLPPPLIVSSGNGLHVYWPLTASVTVDQWKQVAENLKKLTATLGLYADPVRTADAASVLRPVGTTHRKREPKAVEVLSDANDVTIELFANAVVEALQCCGVQPTAPKSPALNTDLSGGAPSYPEVSAVSIAAKCEQIKQIQATKGNVSEPLWYAGIGVLRFCKESPAVVHEWSSGHPDYDSDATQRKIEQHEGSGTGPSTCERFASINPDGCAGCPHKSKIKSPISLGQPEPEVIDAPPVSPSGETLPAIPRNYRRTARGLEAFVKGETEDGDVKFDWQVFCTRDLYPIQRIRVEGVESLTICAHMPLEGMVTFDLPVSVVCSTPSKLAEGMGKYGIGLNAEGAKMMKGYILAWLDELQHKSAAIKTYQQIGWQDDDSIVWGNQQFLPDGNVKEVRLTEALHEPVVGFRASGEVEDWVTIANAYNKPGMEAYQFVVAGGFATPLMLLAPGDYPAALLHMVSGDSGQGKTTVQNVALSIYGDPRRLRLEKQSGTVNFFFGRMAAYRHFPVILDEMTNVESKDLSDFVYRITSGREKGGRKQDGTERKTNGDWTTLIFASSNSSIVGKIAAAKPGANAEILRVFEFYIRNPGIYSQREAAGIFDKVNQFHGEAGRMWVSYLVQNKQRVQDKLQVMHDMICQRKNILPPERYWATVLTCTLTAAHFAKKCGLIDYDIPALSKWALKQVDRMRITMVDNTMSPTQAVGHFLNKFASNIIVVNKAWDARKHDSSFAFSNRGEFRPPIVGRVEKEPGLLYIAKDILNRWAAEHQVSLTELKEALQKEQVLKDTNIKKSLGAGTEYQTALVGCWLLDIHSTALQGLSMQPLESVQDGQSNAAARGV